MPDVDIIPDNPQTPYGWLAIASQWIAGISIIVSIMSLVLTSGTSAKWSVKLLIAGFILALIASALGWMDGSFPASDEVGI